MSTPLRIDYVSVDSTQGSASLMPYATVRLSASGNYCDVAALVDSGAALNVLPYKVGLQLGLDWNEQRTQIRLSGNISDAEARAVLLLVTIGEFPPVRIAFAWSKRNDIPTILGQVNFFMEYDITFCRSQRYFELIPKSTR